LALNDMTPSIESLIPHRRAMCLIDRLVAVDDERAVAEVDVPLDGLFVRDGAVPAWVGLEYMAQTVSLWAGARGARKGTPPRIGFLLGSRRYESSIDAFPGGATLRIEAQHEFMGDNGLGLFECRIALDGRTVATARVSVFEPEDANAILQGSTPT
jgi:predicted hotdog family 3-hydroxylacyl-ACP dehydratase